MLAKKLVTTVCTLLLLLAAVPASPCQVLARENSNSPSRSNRSESSLAGLVPREGLFFYVEMRGAVLQEMLQTGTLAPLVKNLLGPSSQARATDRAAMLAANLSSLPDANFAIASYQSGVIGFAEVESETQAEQLKASLDKVRAKEIAVNSKGKVVFAGAPEAAAWVQKAGDHRVLADDQEFANARRRFGSDPVFGYMHLGSAMNPLPENASPSYAAGYMTGLGAMPTSFAFGGARDGETFLIRAMSVDQTAHERALSGGLSSLTGMFSGVLVNSSGSGNNLAEGFAPANSDIFLELMLDWDRLYDAIGSLASQFGAAMANPQNGGQSVDFLASLETRIGFSIKNDLVPTLGNELAISISGFDKIVSSRTLAGPAATAKPGTAAPRASSGPKFMLILALKDQAAFEKLFNKLLTALGGSSETPTRVPYRNATIVQTKSVSYAVSDGFLIISGSSADVKKSLDAKATGTSLAAQAAYRSVVPESQTGMLHAYFGSTLTSKMVEGLQKGSGGKTAAVRSAEPAGPLGLTVRKDGPDTLMEIRMPLNLVSSLVAAISTIKPSEVWGAPVPGVGIPEGGEGSRTGGRKTPTLTNEDIGRRPYR